MEQERLYVTIQGTMGCLGHGVGIFLCVCLFCFVF